MATTFELFFNASTAWLFSKRKVEETPKALIALKAAPLEPATTALTVPCTCSLSCGFVPEVPIPTAPPTVVIGLLLERVAGLLPIHKGIEFIVTAAAGSETTLPTEGAGAHTS